VIGKDGSGNSAGKDMELDALLSAADNGMLGAIRDNLDLDTGFAQVLGNLAGITPTGQPTGPTQAEPGGQAHRKTPAPAVPETRKEPRYHPKTLTTLALAVITALSIALLFSLSHNYWAVGAQSGSSPKPIAGEPAKKLWDFPPGSHDFIPLASKAGASASLKSAADNAGIGGDPVISYLKDSRSGPVLLLNDDMHHGGDGQVMLNTVQNQPNRRPRSRLVRAASQKPSSSRSGHHPAWVVRAGASGPYRPGGRGGSAVRRPAR